MTDTQKHDATDAARREAALTDWFALEIRIDGNPGKAEAREYARFALTHNTNPLHLSTWAQWVPSADDPLCAVAAWADDDEHGVFYIWAARGVRFALQNAFELARASHPADDGDSGITMLGMTLHRRADGTLCRWDDDSSVVTEWVFKL